MEELLQLGSSRPTGSSGEVAGRSTTTSQTSPSWMWRQAPTAGCGAREGGRVFDCIVGCSVTAALMHICPLPSRRLQVCWHHRRVRVELRPWLHPPAGWAAEPAGHRRQQPGPHVRLRIEASAAGKLAEQLFTEQASSSTIPPAFPTLCMQRGHCGPPRLAAGWRRVGRGAARPAGLQDCARARRWAVGW